MESIFNKGKQLYAYEISGQYDLKEMVDEPEDGIWCSVFDVCKLSAFEIIEPLDAEDFDEAVAFLKESRAYTKHHQKDEISFD